MTCNFSLKVAGYFDAGNRNLIRRGCSPELQYGMSVTDIGHVTTPSSCHGHVKNKYHLGLRYYIKLRKVEEDTSG